MKNKLKSVSFLSVRGRRWSSSEKTKHFYRSVFSYFNVILYSYNRYILYPPRDRVNYFRVTIYRRRFYCP